MKQLDANNLEDWQKKLIDAADSSKENAYSPYSNFFVGASIIFNDESIIAAANCENASFGLSLCAERNVLAMANSLGKRKEIKALALIARGGGHTLSEPIVPCGACRQVISEMFKIAHIDPEAEVIFCSDSKKQNIAAFSIKELLPHEFSGKFLTPQNN